MALDALQLLTSGMSIGMMARMPKTISPRVPATLSSQSIRECIGSTRQDIAETKRELRADKSDLKSIAYDIAWCGRVIARYERALKRWKAALPRAVLREKAAARLVKANAHKVAYNRLSNVLGIERKASRKRKPRSKG